ncbi:MAG TPA: response regulator [Pyrinomonadaceae bacterium]|nr:response regulator [Pyrinomonadaceae bacterium]
MKNIVIVEDNQVVARLYEGKLKAEGNTVHVAYDGAEGLELVHRIKPDLLLVDLMLPNLSGVEIIKTLRKDYRFANLPIMAYSSADESILNEAVQAGTTKILSKNAASFKEILEHVKALIELTKNWQIYPAGFVTENQAGTSGNAAAQKRVLIVEDDPITCSLVAGIVEQNGFTPVVIADGQEAYRTLTEDANFVLAIFDVELPKILGTDLLKYMRTEKRLLSIPVIVMSASENRVKMQIDSHAAGASFFIAKPFDRTTFETLLNALAPAN